MLVWKMRSEYNTVLLKGIAAQGGNSSNPVVLDRMMH